LDNNHVIVVDVGPYPGDVPTMLNKGPESERKSMLPVWSMPKVEFSDWYRSIEQGVTERQQLPNGSSTMRRAMCTMWHSSIRTRQLGATMSVDQREYRHCR
jgi:hypothetical protein